MTDNWEKDPSAKLDYTFDWSDWLQANETVSVSTFTVTPGITVEDDTNKTATTVTIWLSGGVPGLPYQVTSHIETNQGRIDERSKTIRVKDR